MATVAERKRWIRQQYAGQIEHAKSLVESHKQRKADAQWQLKMTKDKAWKLHIENANYNLKQAQDNLKRIKEAMARDLSRVC